jgi:hypothetical protein
MVWRGFGLLLPVAVGRGTDGCGGGGRKAPGGGGSQAGMPVGAAGGCLRTSWRSPVRVIWVGRELLAGVKEVADTLKIRGDDEEPANAVPEVTVDGRAAVVHLGLEVVFGRSTDDDNTTDTVGGGQGAGVDATRVLWGSVVGPQGGGGGDLAGRTSCGGVPADAVRGEGEATGGASGWGVGPAEQTGTPDWSRAWILRGGIESSQVIVLSRSLPLLAFAKTNMKSISSLEVGFWHNCFCMLCISCGDQFYMWCRCTPCH